MKTVSRVLVAAGLALALGCARPDWIEQTLVTADLTGTWESTDDIFIVLTLEQRGQKVTGAVLKPKYLTGAIDGSVAGDELRFHRKNATFEGRMTVSGDEMSGTLRAITYSAGPGYQRATPVRFRRVSPLLLPASEEP